MIKLGEFEGYAGVSWIPRFMGEEDAVIMSYQPRSLRRFVRVHSIDSVESVQPDTNWITAIPFHRGDVNGDGVDDYVGWAYACVLSQPDGSFKRVHRDGSSRYFQDFDRDGMEDGVTYQSEPLTYFVWGDRATPLARRSYVRYPKLIFRDGWHKAETFSRRAIALFRVGGTTWFVEKYREEFRGFPELYQDKIAFHRVNPEDLARHADTITCLDGSIVWDAEANESYSPYIYSFDSSFTTIDHTQLVHHVTEDTVYRSPGRRGLVERGTPSRIGYCASDRILASHITQRDTNFDFGFLRSIPAMVLLEYSANDSCFVERAVFSLEDIEAEDVFYVGASPFPDLTGDGKPELAVVIRRKNVPSVQIFDPYGTMATSVSGTGTPAQPAAPVLTRESIRWIAPDDVLHLGSVIRLGVVDMTGRTLAQRTTDAVTLRSGLAMSFPVGPVAVRFTCGESVFSYVVVIQ